jgi:hypothetical protein
MGTEEMFQLNKNEIWNVYKGGLWCDTIPLQRFFIST